MSEGPDRSARADASLDRLTELIADGLEVDWEAESGTESAGDSPRNDLLLALRAVEGVARASRGKVTDEDDQVAGGRPISTWGDLALLRSLGRGSFGEVYLARDPLLNRLVALKLYAAHGTDPHQSDSILREGRLLARLRHPNIATVYGVDHRDHRFGMWMEFVDGETLANAVRDRGCLSPHETAVIGIELCQALAAIHRMGILHRDIKAQNVIREKGGRVVLVDFGLGLEEHRAALTGPAGTPLYLAPELLAGGRPSVATDIYALGVLLFFLVTGGFPYEGGTLDEVRAAHAEDRRHLLRDLRPGITTRLTRVVERALQPDPALRFRTAGELEVALAGAIVPGIRSRKLQVAMAASLLVAAAAAVGLFLVHRSRQSEPPFANFHGGSSRRLTATPEWETEPALSPDGSFVAFVSNRGGDFDLWLMDTTGGELVQLTSGPAEDRRPRWFPDGTRLVFESIRDGVPSVWTIGRLGGQPDFVLDRAGDPAVSPDGRSIAVSLTGPSGTRRIALLKLDDLEVGPRAVTGSADGFWDHGRPAWSPDGRTICYQDPGNLWLVDVEGANARQLTRDGAGYLAPAWSPDGLAVYAESRREETMAIWRIPVDGSRLERVTFGTGPESEPSLSADGRRLVYATLVEDVDVVVSRLRAATPHPISSVAVDRTPAIAPSGSFVVFSSDRQPEWGLWRADLVNGRPIGEPRLLVRRRRALASPAISPDERWLAYEGNKGNKRGVYVSPIDGGAEQRVSRHGEDGMHPEWGPRGDEIVYVAVRNGQYAITAAELNDGRVSAPQVVLRPPVTALHPRVSPDRRIVAFIGVEGGVSEVWVAPMDEPTAAARKVTSGARAVDLAWLDAERLAVCGLWNGSRWRLKAISLDGRDSDLAAELDLGSGEGGGLFSLTSDDGLIAFSRAEPRGDLWLIDSR